MHRQRIIFFFDPHNLRLVVLQLLSQIGDFRLHLLDIVLVLLHSRCVGSGRFLELIVLVLNFFQEHSHTVVLDCLGAFHFYPRTRLRNVALLL